MQSGHPDSPVTVADASAVREYCVVMPLSSMEVGRFIERSRWPLHVTVCPVFRSGPEDVDVLAAVLSKVAPASSRPAATVGDDADFGPSGATPVQLVESPDLQRLHLTLMDSFASVARVEPVDSEYNGPGYRAHMTVVDHQRRQQGSALNLTSLLLVELAPEKLESMAVPVAVAEIGAAENDLPVTAESAARTWSMLQDEGIRSWIIGGWGIDALLGRITRDHHDLDLLVLDEDLDRMLDLLSSSTARVRFLWSESRWHGGRPSAFVADIDGIEVDVHVIGLEGDEVRILSEHSIELPTGALTGRGWIAGRQVACATAEAQRVMHTGYELPEKHLRDLELLGAHEPEACE